MTQWNAKSTNQSPNAAGQGGRPPGGGGRGGGGGGGGKGAGGGGKGGGGKGGGGLKDALDLAREHFKAKRFDEARAGFEAILEKNPSMAGAYMGLGNIHLAKGEYDEAMEYYNGALHSNKEFAPALVMMGNLLVKQGHKDKAMVKYREALVLNATLASPRLALSRILTQSGRAAEAIECLKEAEQQNPQNEEVQLAFAAALQEQGDLDAAQKRLAVVVERNPESFPALFKLAKLLSERENHKEAIPMCRQALKLKPDAPMVHHLMGQCYLNNGETDLAILEFNTVIELAPTMTAAKFGVVRALMKQDNMAEARKILVELSNGMRSLDMVHHLLGEIFLAQGQYADAVSEYKAALIHGKKLVEKHPELLQIANTAGDDKALAEAYHLAFSKVSFERSQPGEDESDADQA